MDQLKQIIEDVEHLPAQLYLLKSILESGNCNNCAKQTTCKYVPKCGELVRFNCPHYEAEPKPRPEPEQEDVFIHVRPIWAQADCGCPRCGNPLVKLLEVTARRPKEARYECGRCGWTHTLSDD